MIGIFPSFLPSFFSEACTRSNDELLKTSLSLKLSVAVLTLGAFIAEHYCGPAVTRSMHSDDTHSRMWVGSGQKSRARVRIYSNFHRDSNGKNENISLLVAHVCCCASQNVRKARCRPKLVLVLGTASLARTCVRPLPARPVERPD